MTDSASRIQRYERRAIGMTLFWSLLCAAMLYGVLLHVQRRERRLQESIAARESLLREYETPVDGRSLVERIVAERHKQRYLLDEWKRYSNLLETWKRREGSTDAESGETARIDFKVALFNARERLARRAEEAGSMLPADIGISESIESTQSASLRLLQLAAVEQLVGFALDLNVPDILEIEAMPPMGVPTADGSDEYLDRYPIRLRIRCSLNGFVQFLAQIMRAKHFFTVANVHAEKSNKTDPNLLDVTVVFNALVLKDERQAERSRGRERGRRDAS